MEKFIDSINSRTMPQVLFHLARRREKTLMRPLSFYKRLGRLQRNTPADPNDPITYMQTNETLLTDGGASSSENNWLVDVSD